MRMKHFAYIFLAIAAIAMSGCKENDWMDWKTQNELWMENMMHSDDPDIKITADSLIYKIIADPTPTDVRPQASSVVICDYKGKLINGYQFDAGQAASFGMSGLVKGFSEGLTKIHANGDIILYIPWHLGYGEEGSGTEGSSYFIPPYSTLIFEVHVCAVQ